MIAHFLCYEHCHIWTLRKDPSLENVFSFMSVFDVSRGLGFLSTCLCGNNLRRMRKQIACSLD